jgi:hypothetical protein
MTEAEWLRCASPAKMLKFLGKKASERKLRLFACGCCRSIWNLHGDEWSQPTVKMAERFADGSVSVGRMSGAQRRIYRIIRMPVPLPNGSPQVYAANAAKCAASLLPIDVATAIETATIAACAPGKPVDAWSRSKVPAEQKKQCDLLRCIFGNPFHRTASITPKVRKSNQGAVLRIARKIYDEHRFEDLPRLADALEAAGCTSADLLDHCRANHEHVRGCWVVDLVLNLK